MSVRLTVLICAVFMAGAGSPSCNSQDYYPINLAEDRTEVATEVQKASVDILWVVDDSGSMGDEIKNVKDNAEAFTSVLKKMDVDFTLGVISTWNDSFEPRDFRDVGSLRGYPKVLTRDVPGWEHLFVERFPKIGSGGDEKPFFAVQGALQEERIREGGLHEGLVRPGSFLILIVVTDTDDNSMILGTDKFVDMLSGLYPLDKIYYFGILCLSNSMCDTEWNTTDQSQNRLVQLQERVEGQLFSHLTKDYSPYLGQIADVIVGLMSKYELSGLPVLSTIQVLINGKSIPPGRDDGWTYNLRENAIYFHGTGVPTNRDRVEIKYRPTR